jgi:urease accessory protein
MNARVPINCPQPTSEWLAQLNLEYRKTERGSRLVASESKGPLYVQKPFYPEGADIVHTYILHPPGGVVSGDTLALTISLDDDSNALFTTPGAGRVYKARSDKGLQRQTTTITLGRQASAEWLPLETIVFPDANGELLTRISLADGATYIGWEICCLGLPAGNQPFENGSLHQRLEISREGKPLLIDVLELSENNAGFRQSAAGLAGNTVTGLLVAGPLLSANKDLLAQLRELSADGATAGITAVNGFITARYLGSNAEQARRFFTRCWSLLRPALLQRQACEPRIWAC